MVFPLPADLFLGQKAAKGGCLPMPLVALVPRLPLPSSFSSPVKNHSNIKLQMLHKLSFISCASKCVQSPDSEKKSASLKWHNVCKRETQDNSA